MTLSSNQPSIDVNTQDDLQANAQVLKVHLTGHFPYKNVAKVVISFSQRSCDYHRIFFVCLFLLFLPDRAQFSTNNLQFMLLGKTSKQKTLRATTFFFFLMHKLYFINWISLTKNNILLILCVIGTSITILEEMLDIAKCIYKFMQEKNIVVNIFANLSYISQMKEHQMLSFVSCVSLHCKLHSFRYHD